MRSRNASFRTLEFETKVWTPGGARLWRFCGIWHINANVLSFTKSGKSCCLIKISGKIAYWQRDHAQDAELETGKAFRAQPQTRVEAHGRIFLFGLVVTH